MKVQAVEAVAEQQHQQVIQVLAAQILAATARPTRTETAATGDGDGDGDDSGAAESTMTPKQAEVAAVKALAAQREVCAGGWCE